MFDHLIVGIDGRDGGRDAAALARALSPKRMTLVHAYALDAAPPFMTTDFLGAAQAEADRTVETLRDELGLDADTVAIGDRSPARAIQQAAAERGADGIALGSAHHGALSRLLLGDVGRAVLNDAPCAVVVAPRGYAEQAAPPRRIAVGYDDGPEARAALEVARAAADEFGATLTLVTVWDVPQAAVPEAMYLAGDEELIRVLRDAAQERLDAGLATAGPQAKGVLERGEPAHVLSELSEHQDLLVVGSRGWGPVRRIMLGSTSDRLVHRAACPVLVVPRPDDAEGGAPAASDAGDQVTT